MADEIVIIGAADDACRTREVEDSIHRRGCSCVVYLISDEVALWRDSHFLQAIDGCRMVVLVFSQVANSYASVRAGVSTAFRKRKKILPFRLDMTPYCPELDYCLGPAQHIDASTDAGAALIQLERAVESILHPPSHKRKSHGRLKWIAGLVVAVCAIVAWKVWGPGGRIGFVRAFEPILEEAIDAICEDYAGEIADGFAQVVMLDVVTGDYVAHERAFKDGRFSVLPGSLARKNAVLKPYETDRLIIPILAATAMKQAGVTRSVALGEKDWAKSGMLGWSKMLEDEPLEKGLSALSISLVACPNRYCRRGPWDAWFRLLRGP